MAIPLFDGPQEGSYATFKFMLLGRLSFSNLFKACLFSYFEFGFIASTSKAITNGTPMVVIVVCGFVKCKLQVALLNLPCDLPRLPFGVYIVFSFFSSC